MTLPMATGNAFVCIQLAGRSALNKVTSVINAMMAHYRIKSGSLNCTGECIHCHWAV